MGPGSQFVQPVCSISRPGGRILEIYTVSGTGHVNAPIDRCFLLSTSVDLVRQTLKMRPIAGRTSGLIEPNEQVTWYGWKLGLPQLHESLITAYDRPHFFQDTMKRGKFKRFQHDHSFAKLNALTMINDKVRFSLPLGLAGDVVAKRLMVPYIAWLIQRRLGLLKRVAESEEWRSYLPNEAAVADQVR
jgi:ligand-binding SRPBCC domain-containing protein